MGVHGNVNKKKKDLSKRRQERKDAARRTKAKKILTTEGIPASSQAIRTTIKDLQHTHQRLQSRISKKKERKTMKSLLRKEKESNKMETDAAPAKKRNMPAVTPLPTSLPKDTDVEMTS
ncbi:hypothetical protein RvY_09824 [Ramazzottius varieornatus]|uniref:Uncharacterized protein n=1 Tax=Ramazzottius varieornatus TaxID=947166 RepID=A0A1D1VIH7_RAMVA|nr:hypothetical protein RvY_09824 [Ramazzottius varieornatus]